MDALIERYHTLSAAPRWMYYTISAISVGIVGLSLFRPTRRLIATVLGLHDQVLPAGATPVRSTFGVEEYNIRTYDLGLWKSRIGITISVRGPATFAQIRTALLRLQKKHPLWNCGLHKRRGQWWFHEFGDPFERVSIEIVDWVGPKTLESLWDQALNARVDLVTESLLWNAYIVSESTSLHHIAIFQHHSIGDGASLLHLVGDLLRELSQVESNEPEPSKVAQNRTQSIYHQIHHLEAWKVNIPFWRRILPRLPFATAASEYFSQGSHFPVQRGALPDQRRNVSFNTSLPADQLDQFRAICKQRGVTVTAGIMASFVLTCQSVLDYHDDSITIHIPMSIRDRITPRVDRGEYIEAITVSSVSVPMTPDFWECASFISQKILAPDLIQRHIVESEFAIECFNAAFAVAGEQLASVGLNNPFQSAPAVVSCLGVFPEDLYPSKVGNFELERLEIGQSLGAFGAHPAIACFTYCGKFYLNISFAEPLLFRRVAQEILESMLDVMRQKSSS